MEPHFSSRCQAMTGFHLLMNLVQRLDQLLPLLHNISIALNYYSLIWLFMSALITFGNHSFRASAQKKCMAH